MPNILQRLEDMDTVSFGVKWISETDDDGNEHDVPTIGPKHQLSMQCWCHPVCLSDHISHNIAQ